MKKKEKTSSLIRRINGYMQWRRLGRFLAGDALLYALAIAIWCVASESAAGKFTLFRTRNIFSEGVWPYARVGYTYRPAVSAELLTVELAPLLHAANVAVAVLLLAQLIAWIAAWRRNDRFLRELMRPIDELALSAERISAAGIDAQRLAGVEQAIDAVGDGEESVSIGDADLAGLETAINNLLKRQRAVYAEQTRFVDDASHELRTPIAVIHGYASMLERWGKNDPKTLDEAIRAILDESEHMGTLVEQLLFLARGDGGRQKLDLKPLELTALMREVTGESAMIDEKHEYVFEPCEEVSAAADAAMLKQALRILTDNAAKYTPDGGRITLSLDLSQEGSVGLCVRDEGRGVSQQEASHMFERFFRGDDARAATRGSGLGLSIAKWIVDRHHGAIEVMGYQGVGTKMTIRLPRAE